MNPLQLFVCYFVGSSLLAIISVVNHFQWLMYGACGLFVFGVVHSAIKLKNLLNWED
jgi:hypothetical protein